MHKVEAEEDPPLQQQTQETDTVPDDTSLFYREAARPVTHLISCEGKMKNVKKILRFKKSPTDPFPDTQQRNSLVF